MSLRDAVLSVGLIPSGTAPQSTKKRYSELLSKALAEEMAASLRDRGFDETKPLRGMPGEKEFQGGLGTKRVDVSFSDERHGLKLALSVKTICFPPFAKNLKNRFGDLCGEAITLHMRFPYSVVCLLFAFPVSAHEDVTKLRKHSTFQRATRLFATVSGRADYTDAGEKFEHVALLLFHPVTEQNPDPTVRIVDAVTEQELSEDTYFERIREIYNRRNPHVPIGEEDEDSEDERETI